MFNIIRTTKFTPISIITTSENMTELPLTTITIIPINHKLLLTQPQLKTITSILPKKNLLKKIGFEDGD
jgi:hypothetical protein